jgi:hypothetical protein
MAHFDIKETCTKMLGAVKQETGNGWKKIKEVAENFASANEERLKMIADLRISGELNHEDFLKRIEDDKLVLEAQMNALKVIAEAMVQKAVNAAFEIFQKAVMAVLPGI